MIDCQRGGQHLPYSVIARHATRHLVADHCVKCGKAVVLAEVVKLPDGG